MRMRWLLPILVATAACSGCKKKKPVPIDAAPPPIDADISSGAPPGPRVTVPLGEPFSADADGAAGEPGLAVDKDGKPLLAWVEKGRVQVRRWNGSAWDPIGAPPNDTTHRASGKPSLVFEPSGAIVVAWQEMNKKDVNVLQLARWKDNAWTMLPELGDGKAPVMDPVVDTSPLGLVAVWRASEALGKDAVHAKMLPPDESKGWQPVGDQLEILRVAADGTTRRAPALATSKAGVVVGWIEMAPAPVLHVRQWDPSGTSTAVPEPPEGADGDSTLALALGPEGEITLSLSYNIGLRQIVTLPLSAVEWKKIDVPEVSNGYVNGQRLLAHPDGRVLFTYPFGGRFAWWDGKVWIATPVGVMAPSMVVPTIGAGAGDSVYVAWSAGPASAPAKVRVVEIQKKGLGEK